ncbi:STAS domain-containing protein [Kutzneria kofuensis]|uniref:Anti-anti-sigma factor n=1 Tax=Kutzneria kofuensis TaxID=103725 RepID=A0A7W9NLD3_9PSEU|nr:STAS domain-containing protein [Kutzneria kofuensis]MBB5896183.1 anti-anti-sigma factor [Kutzneria kofuensis]
MITAAPGTRLLGHVGHVADDLWWRYRGARQSGGAIVTPRRDAEASTSRDCDVPALRVEALPDQVGVRVAGEVDATVRDSWHATLAPLVDVDGDIHLDLSALTFIDVRGVAELVELAHGLGEERQMVLHQPPRVLRQVMDVLWPDAPRLVMVAAP